MSGFDADFTALVAHAKTALQDYYGIAAQMLPMAHADLAKFDRMNNEELIREAIVLFAGYPFKTAKGMRCYYTIRGNEIFFSRKEKSVTRASVAIALETVLELQKAGTKINGPKMLKCFGANHLYPMLVRFGVIQKTPTELSKP